MVTVDPIIETGRIGMIIRANVRTQVSGLTGPLTPWMLGNVVLIILTVAGRRLTHSVSTVATGMAIAHIKTNTRIRQVINLFILDSMVR